MKRIIFDILILISIGIILFLVPKIQETYGLGLFLYKMLLVSGGFIHAHILRKVAFPYIDFKNEKDHYNNIMVIVLYVVIIWSYAKGG